MEKINLVEILKDCPSGMELDCTMFEGLEFDSIVDNSLLPIRCQILNPDGNGYNIYNFTKYGCWDTLESAKCVIFPKGKTTWEGFQRPFKDGDVVYVQANYEYIAICKELSNEYLYDHAFVSGNRFQCDSTPLTHRDYIKKMRFATEEEKHKLFDAIKDNGYKWNAETKTLEKLVKPKFKVGDKIVERNFISNPWIVVSSISSEYYGLKSLNGSESIGVLPVSEQDNWELVPNKFDITTLKAFDRVLVRDNDTQKWTADLFSFFDKSMIYPYSCVGHYTNQCIPYNDETKHLLGTTNKCSEYYKIWE